MSTEMQTKVQASPAQNFTPVQTGLLQRKSALCNTPRLVEDSERDKEKLTLQRSPMSHNEPFTVPPIVDEVLQSPGQPLDPATRAYMEPRFGHDFSKVRVHTDAKAAESVRAVNARAYTVGKDVVFGEGQYAPRTDAGRHLIAHELAHTIQQQGSLHLQRQRAAASPSDLETMLDTAISIVQLALDTLIASDVKNEAQPASAGDEDRARSLRIAMDNLLALKGTGREDEILRAVQPILAVVGISPAGTQKIKAIQRKAMANDRNDVFEREVEAAADRVSQGDKVEDIVQQRIKHSSTLIIQRQGGPAEATMGALVVAGGPPAWAIAAVVAIIGLGIYAATRPLPKPSETPVPRPAPEEIPAPRPPGKVIPISSHPKYKPHFPKKLGPNIVIGPKPESLPEPERKPKERRPQPDAYPLCWAEQLGPPMLFGVPVILFLRTPGVERDTEDAYQRRLELIYRQRVDPNFHARDYHVHHIVPLFLGGLEAAPGNLVTWPARLHLRGHGVLRYQPQMLTPPPPLAPKPKDLLAHPAGTKYYLKGYKKNSQDTC